MPPTEPVSLPPAAELLRIPVFPPIALRLIQLLADEDVSIGELIELLRSDPGFSAEILRRANSPLYTTREVTTLQHALVVLGMQQLRALTLTVAAEVYLQSALGAGDGRRRCWRHTVACALATEELARARLVHQDSAYTDRKSVV